MYWPDCNIADKSRTVDRMELVTVRQLCWLRGDRETIWKILRYYGLPTNFFNMIKNSYEGMPCRVIHDGQLTKNFESRTGVRQGCLLTPFLFILAIDWIMETETKGKRNGIQWKMLTQLDDLDFADDLALMSHSHRQMQDKTTDLARISAQVGLKINKKKTKILRPKAKIYAISSGTHELQFLKLHHFKLERF